MIRALRPTDVVAYYAFRRHAPDNEALHGPDGAPATLTFRRFLGQSLALEPRRETWVQIEGGQIVGLVSTKARLGADIWDIDQLMAAPAADFDRVVSQLLGHLCRAATEDGVAKVLLRVDADSPCVMAARQTGFFQYTSEYVYSRLTPTANGKVAKVERLRPRRPIDHLALFQLYCANSPLQVRQIEGMTLQEWRWSEGWGSQRFGWRSRRDFVLPGQQGEVVAWLRADIRRQTLRMLIDSDAEADPHHLVRFGLGLMPSGRRVYFAVREHQTSLGSILEEHGFELVGQHALLARTLALRVPETKLVPVHVS